MAYIESLLPTSSSGYEGLWPVLLMWLVILATIYNLVLYPAFLSPLAKIPNAHWSAPLSSAWILWVRFQERENRETHNAYRRKGPIIRLGPYEISVNSVDGGVRNIYGGEFEKDGWYSIFNNYGIPCMFSSWYSPPHAVRKRMLSHLYTKSAIQTSAALSSQAKTILYSRLLPIIVAATDGSQIPQTIEVYDLWNATAMDFITAYLFGLPHSTNFLQNADYRHHWLKLWQSRKKHAFFPQELPRFLKLAHSIGIRLVPRWVDSATQEIEASCSSMCKAATVSIKSKQSPSTNLGDEAVVLKALLESIEKERQQKGSESILKDTVLREPDLSVYSEMLDQLAAGSETVGITMTYLTWHLSRDIELQKALRAELLTLDNPLLYPPSLSSLLIEQSFKDGQDDWLNDIQMPSSKKLDSLPILHAVVMETLRINGAIPGSQPRVTPYPSCTLGEYEVPGGVRVESACYSIHRNDTVYPNPMTFDHTRWLDSSNQSDEARRERDRWFWPFSSGGRMCLGSNFAMQEKKLITAAIYTNFTTHIVNDDGIEQLDGYTSGPTGNQLLLRFEKA